MQIITDVHNLSLPVSIIEEYCPIEKALFIDIETTGLSKETTTLYLIGCGYYKNNSFETTLFFADDPSEELEILLLFKDFITRFTHFFHYNGTKFDIPYLTYKTNKYNIEGLFDSITQVDVYYLLKPLRYLLFPTSMRQKCVEDFLGIERDDKYNGGELISVYHSYVKTNSDHDFSLLITHNKDDVIGMAKILPIIRYKDLCNASLTYIDSKVNDYKGLDGNTKKELLLNYKCNISFSKSFSSKTDTLYLWADADTGIFTFRLIIYSDTKKVFFDNYKDYYYLPDEDTCIFRSVAMGLSKGSYQKATKNTCYQKKTGDFIKQPSHIFTPVFKDNYKDRASYFLYPDCFTLEKADEFGTELLNVFIKKRR